jgi:hypothetical protein
MTNEEIAKKIANNMEPIRDIKCPDGVLSPGMYFGAMRGMAVKDAQYACVVSALKVARSFLEACMIKNKAPDSYMIEEIDAGLKVLGDLK